MNLGNARTRKIRVAQLGARMHYAVPRILASRGWLESLHTDVIATPSLCRWLKTARLDRFASVRRLMARRPEGLTKDQVCCHNSFGLAYYWRQRAAKSKQEQDRVQLWAGSMFSALASNHLERCGAIYAFNTSALECFERAQFDGVATILEQTIAPRRLELELLAESEERYPQWRDPEGRGLSQYFAEREEQEWTLADTIVCGSDFVKRGLMRQGIPGRQIHVVPYGIDPPADWSPKTTLGNRLRVLFVGSINARKGVPALMEASEKLPCCEFRLVGGGRLPEGISIPSNVRIVGPVPRTEVSHHYRWADVFLLPSLCEGSATVIYEALSQGVPVICTPNAGSVVRDGMEGKIIPALDPAAIREALESFLAAPNTLEPCSQRARSRALEHTLESYGDRLLTALAPMEVALGR